MMFRYDKDWDEADNRWAELRAKATKNDSETPKTTYVVLEKYPETDVVPKRVIKTDESRDTDKTK